MIDVYPGHNGMVGSVIIEFGGCVLEYQPRRGVRIWHPSSVVIMDELRMDARALWLKTL